MKLVTGLLAVAVLSAQTKPADKPVTIDDPRTVTITERSVPTINVCRYQETLVTLPAGERVMKAFVADTKNWKLESGRDDQASRYLSIKVVEPLTQQTTINVVSDHDVPYTLHLVLNAEHCDSKVSIDADAQIAETIKKTDPWLPPAEAAKLKAQAEQAQKEAAAAAQKAQQQADAYKASYPSQLHFSYRYDPKAAEKLGVHSVFDDGKFTYVKGSFEETPTFYELKEGKPSLISFDFQNGIYSTARIVNDGYLAVGGNGNGKHQERLDFHRVPEAN